MEQRRHDETLGQRTARHVGGMAPVTLHPIFSVLAFIRQAFFHPRLRVELVLIERDRERFSNQARPARSPPIRNHWLNEAQMISFSLRA